MVKLLKVFGRGVLVTLMLPFIALIWVGYGIYCLGLFIVMFFKAIIEYFQGKTFNYELLEDIEARREILEKEQADEQQKQALNIMYQNAIAAQMNAQASIAPQTMPEQPASNPQPYGTAYFNPQETTEQKPEEQVNTSNEETNEGGETNV